MHPDTARKTELLVGSQGMTTLDRSMVAVMGLGGVGSACVESLARAGVGHLLLADYDVVSPSNINRQVIAFTSTVGQPKVDVMAAMVADINPTCDVLKHATRIYEADVAPLLDPLAGRLSYVVDAQDTVTTKLALAQWCQDRGVPFISSMGAGNKFDPGQLTFRDLYETSDCPLCKSLRKQARKRGITAMRVLFSTESPLEVPMAPGARRDERTCVGTISYLPPIMGMMLAAQVIRDLLGQRA